MLIILLYIILQLHGFRLSLCVLEISMRRKKSVGLLAIVSTAVDLTSKFKPKRINVLKIEMMKNRIPTDRFSNVHDKVEPSIWFMNYCTCPWSMFRFLSLFASSIELFLSNVVCCLCWCDRKVTAINKAIVFLSISHHTGFRFISLFFVLWIDD